ncbi:CAAX farnesyltransferase (FTase) subunit beta [Collariella sp. IMI 366227]|nr:CAAX farnesyltransferase (FTase) subunit beta [Collariella sp. IMI 366227]
MAAQQQQRASPSSSSPAQLSSDTETVDEEIVIGRRKPGVMIPDLFTQPPSVRDTLVTATSITQDDTVDTCLPFLSGEEEGLKYNEHGLPGLDRERHVRFLHQSLGRLPGRFVAADASRPWFLYWCLSALGMMGEDLTSFREPVMETARSMQNEEGGFGGGHRQVSHLATTYAVVLALALVGGQTFEGGISGQPNAEAHGAYAFCALGCLALLDHPSRSIPSYLDVPRLIAWLSSRQYAPEGGFSGRTNKLVDGCYSHWVGGCFPLIEACLNNSGNAGLAAENPTSSSSSSSKRTNLPPTEESLFSREGLIRYILCCCQDQTRRGGLRDKPGKMSDSYHTCYVLSGLSSAQHQWELDEPESEPDDVDTNIRQQQQAATATATEAAATASAAAAADAVWAVLPYLDGVQLFDNKDRVRPIHPVYAIPQQDVRAMKGYFEEGGF